MTKKLQGIHIFIHGFFLALFIMSFLYYKERLYSDSAYYVAHILDTGGFYVGHQRLVLVLSEFFPLRAFSRTGNLEVVYWFYSAGHVIVFYIIALLVLYPLKQEWAALALVLILAIGRNWLYFSPMIEICYGGAILILFLAMLKRDDLSPFKIVVLCLVEVLVLTSHPLSFFMFLFFLADDTIRKGFRKQHVAFIITFLAVLLFKYVTLNEYEGGKINYLFNPHANKQYENLFDLGYYASLGGMLIRHYPDLLCLFLLSAGLLWKRRSFITLAFYGASVFGFILLINATNYAGVYSRYNESLYYPLVVIICSVLLSEAWGTWSRGWKGAAILFFLMVIVYRIDRIADVGRELTMRVHQMENIISLCRDRGVSKGIVREENLTVNKWQLNWSYPMESLLISSMKKGGSVSLVTDEDLAERDPSVPLTPESFIFRRWEIREIVTMPSFFKVKKEDYFVLSTSDTIKTNADSFTNTIELQIENGRYEHHGRIYLPVRITNRSGKILHAALSDSCYLYSVLENEGGQEIFPTPLEVDVPETFSQYVSFPADHDAPKTVRVELRLRQEVIAISGSMEL